MSPVRGYRGDVAKQLDKAETKVRLTHGEKEWFERAAETSRRSLNQWLIAAAAEKAERDGVPREEKRGKGGR